MNTASIKEPSPFLNMALDSIRRPAEQASYVRQIAALLFKAVLSSKQPAHDAEFDALPALFQTRYLTAAKAAIARELPGLLQEAESAVCTDVPAKVEDGVNDSLKPSQHTLLKLGADIALGDIQPALVTAYDRRAL